MTQELNQDTIFEVNIAQNSFIGVLSIPHSGLLKPRVFKDFLVSDQSLLNCDVDFEVHKLINIKELNQAGITVIKANIHRTCIDLNRSRDLALLNWKKNSRGVTIVSREADAEQAEELLAQYYDPYFEMLKVLINELALTAPKPISFVDLHSMPSVATEYHLKQNPNQNAKRPDFCLSDQHGVTSTQEFINFAVSSLRDKGYQALINNPYIGGYITKHINKHFQDINNIQIEISRALYMDESIIELKENLVADLKPKLTASLIALFKEFNRP